MVDHVIEIPLPGRTLVCAMTGDRGPAARVAIDAFIAGPENRLAAMAVNRLLSVSDTSPAPSVLVILGPSGTGKSHLARGLARSRQTCGTSGPAEEMAYLTAADFHHQLVDAIDADTVVDFRARLRSYQLLVIDDVDHLPSSDFLQEELRATIDAYEEAGRLFVATSATPICAARNLSASVRSRLAGGLSLQIEPPAAAARRELVRHISTALGQPLSLTAAERLANAVPGTAGDMFGVVFELNAQRSPAITNDVIAVEQYLAARAARRPTIRSILQAVARYYRLPQKVLKSSSRRQSAVTARSMAVYLARELAGLSYDRIGSALGGRDHTTIMHSYRKIAEALTHDPETKSALADLQSRLRQAG